MGFTGRGPRFGNSIVVVVSSGEWRQTRIAVATTAVAAVAAVAAIATTAVAVATTAVAAVAVVTFVIGIATGLSILR